MTRTDRCISRFLGVGFAVLALAGLLMTSTASADPEATTHILVPFEFISDNPCTGEPVSFTGELRQVVTSHLDRAGHIHLAEAAHLSLLGTGLTSGAHYRYIQTSPDSVNFDLDGFPFEASGVTTARTIGEGSIDDFLVHLHFHITINADGDVTSTVDSVRTECLG
jgi:hypothetical protein